MTAPQVVAAECTYCKKAGTVSRRCAELREKYVSAYACDDCASLTSPLTVTYVDYRIERDARGDLFVVYDLFDWYGLEGSEEEEEEEDEEEENP